MKLSAPIFRLKRRAKLMARETGAPLSEALNNVAREEGFRAWSLLAARYAEDGPARTLFARLAPGDLLLLGARPLQGKTLLALALLAEARKAGRDGAFFTLEYTQAEARERVKAAGLDAASPGLLIDTSDAISADHMMARLGAAKPGAVVIVDYLQALDEQRAKPPLCEQIAALKAFAQARGLIFVFIAQIDRRYDAAAKPLPSAEDVRLPNALDIALFSKTCFLREGEMAFSAAGRAA